MWVEAYAYVSRLNTEIANSSGDTELLRQRLERATQLTNEAHEMYNDALTRYRLAYMKYYTFMYVNNIDNTRQIM